jgi:hypothetical protein
LVHSGTLAAKVAVRPAFESSSGFGCWLDCCAAASARRWALKRWWRPDVYDVASSNQFTCSGDCAAQVRKAFGDGLPRPRVLSLQHIPASNCSNRRRRLLKKFDQAHALNVTRSKNDHSPFVTHATFDTNLQAPALFGQIRPWIGAVQPQPHRSIPRGMRRQSPNRASPSHEQSLNRKRETIHVGLSHSRQFWRWYSANPFGFSVSARFVSSDHAQPAPCMGPGGRAALEDASTRHLYLLAAAGALPVPTRPAAWISPSVLPSSLAACKKVVCPNWCERAH